MRGESQKSEKLTAQTASYFKLADSGRWFPDSGLPRLLSRWPPCGGGRIHERGYARRLRCWCCASAVVAGLLGCLELTDSFCGEVPAPSPQVVKIRKERWVARPPNQSPRFRYRKLGHYLQLMLSPCNINRLHHRSGWPVASIAPMRNRGRRIVLSFCAACFIFRPHLVGLMTTSFSRAVPRPSPKRRPLLGSAWPRLSEDCFGKAWSCLCKVCLVHSRAAWRLR